MTRSASTEDLEDRLRVEFVDDARDRLQVMYDALDGLAKGERSEVSVIGVIRLETHNFKGMGTSFGFPTVSLIAHRLEDYLNGLTRLGEREISDIQTFLDRTSQVVDRAEQPALAETNQIIRALPVRYRFEVTDVDIRDVEIMLVTPSKVVAKKVGGELAACGFRTVTVSDPIESISIAVRVPPDMLIASLVMDGLSGLDLIRGLRAMSITKDVPMALLTSMSLDNPALKEIPQGVAVIRVGEHFGEDFAGAVTRFNLG
ncbi:CheY-like chemotaxis protein/HPt (histidine-containing phosphotransfer) domain-containing protein [Azospirillum fermentarium]|uniref:Hpt domain-containing protein n=1 Tax=Azospirillum fermentarium TaxID=1233114 RepID=UPI00222669E2|nr:Hpt domain-containing protein [Azospirillum fermentarium]MCW2245005.1 CheY-like chemotaxis protein/HPt (histidine-containing phosphotransfer) domain-containing protein [Azospirillum fermentarium]